MESGEELGEVEEGETIVKIYYEGGKAIFSKRNTHSYTKKNLKLIPTDVPQGLSKMSGFK